MDDAAIPFARQRTDLGFLDLGGLARLAARGNLIPAPEAVLIAAAARIGSGNRFYPGTLLQAIGGTLEIGDGNCFWPGTTVVADGGVIRIGNANQFGPGGFSAILEGAGTIEIGSCGRYREGAMLQAGTSVGDGCQVLGPIQVQGCRLEGGGSFADPDPHRRGGVLKGVGRARGLAVGRGRVILGEGRFDIADLTEQARFHPPPEAP